MIAFAPRVFTVVCLVGILLFVLCFFLFASLSKLSFSSSFLAFAPSILYPIPLRVGERMNGYVGAAAGWSQSTRTLVNWRNGLMKFSKNKSYSELPDI